MLNFRNRKDYCSVIAKAAGVLGQSTADARHRVYERARSTVLAEMNRAYPPVDQADILAAQMCLEAAIKEIEAAARRNQPAKTEMDISSTAHPGGLLRPSAANQNGEQLHAPITRRWVRVFRSDGGRGPFRRQVLSDYSPGEPHSGGGHDPWLTELLARASRDEDDQKLRRLPR
jgi:hypothetical protein